jgi:hypothetical protein
MPPFKGQDAGMLAKGFMKFVFPKLVLLTLFAGPVSVVIALFIRYVLSPRSRMGF